MIMHRLFVKQYLQLSPVWLAYQQNKKIPTQYFQHNYKLLSAYSLTQRHKLPQNFKKLLLDISKSDYIPEKQSIYKITAFLGYDFSEQISQKFIENPYIKSLSEWGSSQTQQTRQNFINQFIKKSNIGDLDDIDWLIIGSFPHNTKTLKQLSSIQKSVLWTKTSHSLLQNQIINMIKQSNGWTDINSLNKILNLWKTYSFIDFKQNNAKLLLSLSQLFSEQMIQDQNHSSSTLRDLIKVYKQKNRLLIKNFRSQANSDLIAHYYCIYLNWLCVKTLVSKSVEQFITNFDIFVNISLLEFQDIKPQTPLKYAYINLVKIQMIEYIIRQVNKTEHAKITNINHNYNKKSKKYQKQKNLIQDLKVLKKRQYNKYSQYSKLVHDKVQSCVKVINICGNIQASTIKQFAIGAIKQLIDKPIIILSNTELKNGIILTDKLQMKNQWKRLRDFAISKKILSENIQNLSNQHNHQIISANQIKELMHKNSYLTQQQTNPFNRKPNNLYNNFFKY